MNWESVLRPHLKIFLSTLRPKICCEISGNACKSNFTYSPFGTSIIGLDGKVYSTTSFNGNSTSVNVASLASGIYVYEIVAENGSVTRSTFVKK